MGWESLENPSFVHPFVQLSRVYGYSRWRSFFHPRDSDLHRQTKKQTVMIVNIVVYATAAKWQRLPTTPL